MASSERASALGRYVLDEPIATSTTATIWRGHDAKTGRQVAVKRFHQHLLGDATARRRMKNEANSARRVRARTIVSAIDTISTRDEFAIVFPFVAGASLAERLRTDPPLDAQAAAAIAADVADALVAIHRAGLVHRDVKPGNVLLANDGRALLLDFGISRAVSDGIAADQQLTGAGLAIGTLPYMAPEQLAAARPTSATDVYGLGVLLYEMLSGRLQFEASSPVGLATEQRVPPARIGGAPEPLMGLTLRALAVEPRSRPTAQQMSAALRGWIAAPSAADAPTSLQAAASAVPPPRRRLAWGPLALAGVGAMVIGIIVALAAAPPGELDASPGATAVALAPVPSPTPRPKPTSAPQTPTPTPAATPKPSNATASPPPASTPKPKPPAKPKHGHHHVHGHHGHHGHKHHRHH